MAPKADSPKDGRASDAEVLHEQREWLRVTLDSIGDAVITTDTAGAVTFLNPVAELLTGWTLPAAAGRPLETVFRIVNEETRRTVENPAVRSLREGVVVGLGNHTLLIARDGAERPIDDSAAPIRGPSGVVVGVVLVFRDVTERRRAEHALRQSEERFRLLVEGVRDYAIFPLDPHGVVVGWNLGAERINGYTADEIIGRHFSCFYPPDAIAAGWPDQELAEAATTGRFEDEGWRLRKDGSRIWAHVVITALRDRDGGLRGYSKVTRDLTERKSAEDALRANEQHLRAVTEAAADAIITADEDGLIVSWNPAAQALFGHTEPEAVGRPLTILMPQRFEAAHLAGLARQRAGGESRVLGRTVELAGRRKDGREFPLELSLAATETDAGRLFVGIVRDVTERKEHEAARLELARANAQAEALADLNRRKDEFLAMLSHELRNPLSAILNASQLLRMRQQDDPVQLRAQGVIERQLALLTDRVDDLLEVSRITTGTLRLQRERTDLRLVVELAVEAVQPLVEANRHELSVSLPDEPAWVDADPGRLEQVVVNLLDNAAKYTDAGGRIELGVRVEGGEALLRVRDSGVGIPADLLPHLFEPFTQAERSLDRSQGGMGIGLTVVKSVVELHGGRVEARSEGAGRGSEFLVRLPLASPAMEAAASAGGTAAAEGPRTPLRLLVVDDNRDTADTAAMLLRLSGHEVRVAYDGTAALEEAGPFRPDVVLLDIGLPGMDGYEVARRLGRDPERAKMLVVAVTGYGQDADRRRSSEAGFDAHLVKPVDPSQLQGILARSPRGEA